MNQFDDFKNEESFRDGKALHSLLKKDQQREPVPGSNGVDKADDLALKSCAQTIVGLQHDQEQVVLLIQQVLTELLPYIASHGGHVELVEVRDAVVFIKFSGTCVQCPLSFYTVTYGIERHIKVKIPWILRVEVIED